VSIFTQTTYVDAELKKASKTYMMGNQRVSALSDISVRFDRGSFWAIMGPSGSGKSTMLNLMGCLDRPTSGHYILGGQDVSKLSDNELSEIRLRRLGFIFQSFNLIEQLTVEENIYLPLYYLGWEHDQSTEHARNLARMVGLHARLNHRPSELSGGQQQRVAIARSLANNPAILLADEPTGNLDSATGKEILSLLRKLNEQGKTIIMVTHEPAIAAYAKNKLHMQDGCIKHIEEL
jgi:putative ABC transport system ATP-binding protein